MSPSEDPRPTTAQQTSDRPGVPRSTARLILQPDTPDCAVYELSGSVVFTVCAGQKLNVAPYDGETACAMIELADDGSYHLRDTGPAAPAWVNGRYAGDVRLTDGDILSFDGIKCHFEEGWAQAGT
jgi:hypothetical protein